MRNSIPSVNFEWLVYSYGSRFLGFLRKSSLLFPARNLRPYPCLYVFLRNSFYDSNPLPPRIIEVRRAGQKPWWRARWSGEHTMQDLTMLIFTVVFFVLAFLYVKACQKLR